MGYVPSSPIQKPPPRKKPIVRQDQCYEPQHSFSSELIQQTLESDYFDPLAMLLGGGRARMIVLQIIKENDNPRPVFPAGNTGPC